MQNSVAGLITAIDPGGVGRAVEPISARALAIGGREVKLVARRRALPGDLSHPAAT